MDREEEIKEKARYLAIKYCNGIDHHGKKLYNVGYAIACCEMAEWADQHPRKGLWDSEKVIEWLRDNQRGFILTDIDIEDLRKAMEGGLNHDRQRTY